MATENCDTDTSKLSNLIGALRSNYASLQNEFHKLREEHRLWSEEKTVNETDVIVSKSDLQRLDKEIRLLKAMLSTMTSRDIIPVFERASMLRRDLQESHKQIEMIKNECQHWRVQWEVMTDKANREKEEKLALSCELHEINQQFSQQSDFCATMGAACCTLLWRVTRCEDSIPTILVGTKVDEFLAVVSSTLESYLQTYSQEPAPANDSDEMQFVLALCGIITNVAATAYGRDFLLRHSLSEQIIDTFIKVLAQEPCKKFSRLKNIILMALYNLTINQKGLKTLSSRSDLLSLLVWQLKADNELENQLHCIRLFQSIVCEQPTLQLVHQAKELMQGQWLDDFCRHPNEQLREAAKELQADVCILSNET